MMTHLRSKQQGVALLVVLLIVAIIALLATEITSRSQLALRRTANVITYDQAYWYAISAEGLAKNILKQDLEDSDGVVHLQQYWAQANAVFPAERGEIAGEIRDLRSCFNLNALAQPSSENSNGLPQMPLATRQFQGLLIALGLDQFSAEQLSQRIKDYLDSDDEMSPYGAESADYEARTVPYRAANTLMFDKSELRAILGVNQRVFQTLAPYVCVIPGRDEQLLNINTLAAEHSALLAGMLENKISVGEAENILSQRPTDGYDEIDKFWQDANLGADLDNQAKSSFTVTSDFFLLNAGAHIDNAIFQMESILQYKDGQSFVLSRQFGAQNQLTKNTPTPILGEE